MPVVDEAGRYQGLLGMSEVRAALRGSSASSNGSSSKLAATATATGSPAGDGVPALTKKTSTR